MICQVVFVVRDNLLLFVVLVVVVVLVVDLEDESNGERSGFSKMFFSKMFFFLKYLKGAVFYIATPSYE